jgi:HAD superfamily hydrolase (TIGR01509 family)
VRAIVRYVAPGGQSPTTSVRGSGNFTAGRGGPIAGSPLGQPVEAVLFDLFDTLVTVDPSRLPVLQVGGRRVPSTLPAVLDELCAACPAVTQGDALAAMAAVRAEPRAAGEAHAEVAEHVIFAAVLRRLGVRDDGDRLARRLADTQMAAIVGACRPRPDAGPLLAALRRRAVPTAIVSNLAHAASAAPLAAVAAPGHRFDALVTSIDVGYCKPDGRPFRVALARLGVEACRAVHVGDDPAGDVAGAAEAGIHPVWFNPSGRAWPGSGAAPTAVTSLRDVEALVGPPGSTAV